jgi:lysozyme family protein
MEAYYDDALARLLAHEGGYSHHPSDPGGPTKYGITIADYTAFKRRKVTAGDVKAMPLADAKAIYRDKYWKALRCSELPAGLDYAVFDYGVNSGIGRAARVLRRLLSLSDSSTTVTDQVIAAATARDSAALVNALCDERLRFLKSLRTWPVFGKGWGRRVAEVRAAALAMIRARGSADAVRIAATISHAGKGVVPAAQPVRQVLAPLIAAGSAAALVDPSVIAAHPIETMLIALAMLVIAAALIVIMRRRVSIRQQQPMPDTASLPVAALH